jgi:hypothetical protein
MNLIDPFIFSSMFGDARSFAIVGNAPTILEYEHGSKIDSYDVVVRFNRATTQGVEKQIGSRTDLLVVNASNTLAMAPSPAESVKPRCLVSFVSPQGVPKIDRGAFSDWTRDLPILIGFGPDLIGLKPVAHSRPLTSGTYILFTLLRMLTIERLYISGFTMFGAAGGASGKYYHDPRVGVGAYHDTDAEAEIFRELVLSSGVDLELTDETSQLVYGTANSDGQRSSSGGRSSAAMRKRIAGGVGWRLINMGTRLRRFSEMR